MLFLCAGWPNPTISPLAGEPNEEPWRSGADLKSPVAGRPDFFFSCVDRPNPLEGEPNEPCPKSPVLSGADPKSPPVLGKPGLLFLCAGWPNPPISPLEGEPNEKP